ncbi:MAG: hypothetical protein U0744_09825 [Gemmataceae bacterium]
MELETIAQTWSEHCSHKTLKGRIDFEMTDAEGRTSRVQFENLLKETIFGATQELRQRAGADDWCVSVFSDNAGVVKFDDRFNVCFKVENAQPPLGHRTLRRGQHRHRRRHPRSARHRYGRQNPFATATPSASAPPDAEPDTLPCWACSIRKR